MGKLSLRERIIGCIRGKAIGGTLGTPVEGRMELLQLTFYDPVPKGILPNDDFDIQLLFLEAVEESGGLVDSHLLARVWFERMGFPFDEYGVATLNYRRGLRPPVMGWYDNPFKNCMGSPIRSEIWAMLAPNRPNLAAYFAMQDSMIDHGAESIAGEMFFSALESMAFSGETDFIQLIETALQTISPSSQTFQALRYTLDNFQKKDWQQLRKEILEKFGHPNFTEAPQNIAFTIFGLLYYPDDFEKALLCTTNCGYDTDCTAATIGAIWGLVKGDNFPKHWVEPIGEKILASHGVRDMATPVSIDDLADHVIKVKSLIDKRYGRISEKQIAEQIKAQLLDLSCFKPNTFSELKISGKPVIENKLSLKVKGKLKNAYCRYPFAVNINKGVIAIQTKKNEFLPNTVRISLEELNGTLSDLSLVTPHHLWAVDGNQEDEVLRKVLWPKDSKSYHEISLQERSFYLKDLTSKKFLALRGYFHISLFDKYRFGTFSECPVKVWVDGNLLLNREKGEACIPAPHRFGPGKQVQDIELRPGWHRLDILLNASLQMREGKSCIVIAQAYTKQLIDYRLRLAPSGVYNYGY